MCFVITNLWILISLCFRISGFRAEDDMMMREEGKEKIRGRIGK